MERIEQRTGTDCVKCCVAMLTGRAYEDVPDFVAEHGESWAKALQDWLDPQGMGLICFDPGPPTDKFFIPGWLPVMVLGATEGSAVLHCVVFTKEECIDPHPGRRGILTAERRFAIIQRLTGQG